jgi:hypothetical protein
MSRRHLSAKQPSRGKVTGSGRVVDPVGCYFDQRGLAYCHRLEGPNDLGFQAIAPAPAIMSAGKRLPKSRCCEQESTRLERAEHRGWPGPGRSRPRPRLARPAPPSEPGFRPTRSSVR